MEIGKINQSTSESKISQVPEFVLLFTFVPDRTRAPSLDYIPAELPSRNYLCTMESALWGTKKVLRVAVHNCRAVEGGVSVSVKTLTIMSLLIQSIILAQPVLLFLMNLLFLHSLWCSVHGERGFRREVPLNFRIVERHVGASLWHQLGRPCTTRHGIL